MAKNKYHFISSFEDIDITSWENLIENTSKHSVYQTRSIYDFWKSQDNCNPYVFGIKSDTNLLALCVVVIQSNGSGLKEYFSRRAIIYGGPIINSESNKNEVFDFLLKEMNKFLGSKAIYGEFRNTHSYLELDSVFNNNNYKYIPYQNFKIALTDEDAIFSNFTSEKRRQIRRSFKEGVEISYKNSEQNIKGVYDIINNIYIERVKKPLPEFSFFNELANSNFGSVVALKYENKIIGGGFLVYDKYTVYDWYRGGLDREYKHQYPSTLAAWAAMKFGLLNNHKEFDFMGAGIRGEDYGVRNFKAQFGGDLVEHGRYNITFNSTMLKIAKTGLAIVNKIKK